MRQSLVHAVKFLSSLNALPVLAPNIGSDGVENALIAITPSNLATFLELEEEVDSMFLDLLVRQSGGVGLVGDLALTAWANSRSNVFKTVCIISTSGGWHSGLPHAHAFSDQLLVHNILPEKFVLFGDWLKECFDEVLRWLDSEDSQYATFCLYPQRILFRVRIYETAKLVGHICRSFRTSYFGCVQSDS